jgi:hypothetical protein
MLHELEKESPTFCPLEILDDHQFQCYYATIPYLMHCIRVTIQNMSTVGPKFQEPTKLTNKS